MPPGPPKKPGELPPHPATVAQRKQPFGARLEKPPHLAAAVQPRAAPGEQATKVLPPHPATVVQAKRPLGARLERPLHPATLPMGGTVQRKGAEARRPPHPATAGRALPPPPATAQPAQVPSEGHAADASSPGVAQPYLAAAGVAVGGWFGSLPGAIVGGAAGMLLDHAWSAWGEYTKRTAMTQAFSTITQNLGYVTTACVRQALAAAAPAARDALVNVVVAANGATARAYALVQGLFGGAVLANPTQVQLRGLIAQIDANTLVNGWGLAGTSDPRNDNLGHATAKLIVHSFTPYAPMNAGGVPGGLNAYIDNAVVTGVHGKVAVRTCAAYLDNAAHPGGNYCLSTSLIGKVQRGTIGPVGIILNVPAWNLLLIGPRDLNIDNGAFGAWAPDRLCAGQTAPRQISANGDSTSLEAIEAHTPAQLIAATHNYSELGVIGPVCLRGTAPVVTGIFVVVKNGNLCEDGGYLDQATITMIDDDPVSANYRVMLHKSYYRNIGQLAVTSMVDRIAQASGRHNIPIVTIDNPTTSLPESDVALADLTGNGGAWNGLNVIAF